MPWVKSCERCVDGIVHEGDVPEDICHRCVVELSKARYDEAHE